MSKTWKSQGLVEDWKIPTNMSLKYIFKYFENCKLWYNWLTSLKFKLQDLFISKPKGKNKRIYWPKKTAKLIRNQGGKGKSHIETSFKYN